MAALAGEPSSGTEAGIPLSVSPVVMVMNFKSIMNSVIPAPPPRKKKKLYSAGSVVYHSSLAFAPSAIVSDSSNVCLAATVKAIDLIHRRS